MLLLYWRNKGGAIIVVKSQQAHSVIPHAMWTDEVPDCAVLQFKPYKRYRGWRAVINSPFFHGKWIRTRIGNTNKDRTI